LGRGLRDEFPNPERVGCPAQEIVAAIAAHRMPLSQAEAHLDHLTSCSPCYRDFLRLQADYRRRRARMIFAVAASVLIVAATATWVAIQHHSGLQVARSAIVDLRDRSMSRGTQTPPDETPIEIGSKVSRLEIYLPIGTGDGGYEFRVTTRNGDVLVSGTGIAKIEPGTTLLEVDASLSSVRPGLYVLQLRKVGSEWSSYALRIR
jgi:hypothetical protein